jgi:hypothetical protein
LVGARLPGHVRGQTRRVVAAPHRWEPPAVDSGGSAKPAKSPAQYDVTRFVPAIVPGSDRRE